jgi:glycosyltransferase involved in cell wall biosynthesis
MFFKLLDEQMKVSVITATLNGARTIEDTIRSVLSQSFKNIEYIVIDGGSNDSTLDILNNYEGRISRVISEPDNGIYDAMNKGIRIATGDIIGVLNSDDYFADDYRVEKIVDAMTSKNTESCHGDVIFIKRDNPNKIVRYWKEGQFSKWNFKIGWMPYQGTFYVKRQVFEKYGAYLDGFPLAGDYELMLRFLYKYKISTTYIPEVMLKVRTGGASKPGICNTVKMMMENSKAWKVNDLKPSPITFFLKPLRKIPQYIRRP